MTSKNTTNTNTDWRAFARRIWAGLSVEAELEFAEAAAELVADPANPTAAELAAVEAAVRDHRGDQ